MRKVISGAGTKGRYLDTHLALRTVAVAATDTAVSPPPASLERRVIVPSARRVTVGDLWHSRRVARVLAARDLKVKYKQSLVGPPWLILQPLGILGGLVVAFHGVATVDTGGVPYP